MSARGFTLIEVMIAGALLAAGGAALVSGYCTLAGVAEHQRRLSAAVHVTKGKVEELLAAQPSSPLLAGAGGTVFVDTLGLPAGDRLTKQNYAVTWTFERDTPVEKQMRIGVVTSWQEQGRVRTTRFTTGRSQ